MYSSNSVYVLSVNALLSVFAYFITKRLIPKLSEKFIKAQLFGIDMSKSSKLKIPEAQGVVCGAVFLVTLFIFIPVAFIEHLTQRDTVDFPFHEYVHFLAALLSICCMIFLGFADDVLDLRWRDKLLLPTIASLPLLTVYFVTYNLTVIIVPLPLRPWLGYSVNIGVLYYFYMGMLAVFCTNAINIVAGINGIEAGQSLVIAGSVIIFNLIELSGEYPEAHLLSLYFLLPFFAVCLALLQHNWYPSKVFVGDTFCYFAGMTFAVVAILGHFSKTMLLFFIPQVVNFILSVPQLFRLVPCPRHRLPCYHAETNTLHMSFSKFKQKDLGFLGRWIVKVLGVLGLVQVHYGQGDDGGSMEVMNMTIINLTIKLLGPLNEGKLTTILLTAQVFCSALALFVRYPLARLVYDQLH